MSAARDWLFHLIAGVSNDGSRPWCDEARLRLDAHRAEVLAEGAEAIDVKQDEYEAEERQRFGHLDHETVLQREAVRDMAALLRQMADEGKATAPAATLTVYRAEWYGDPLCTYTNLKAAQKHCEAAARINLFDRDDVPVSWTPDDEDDPAIWDLVERRGDVKEPTGYCVVGASVASEYDEGAGE